MLRKRQGYLLPLLLLYVVLEVPAKAIRQEKKLKGIYMQKEGKFSIIANDMLQYIIVFQIFT